MFFIIILTVVLIILISFLIKNKNNTFMKRIYQKSEFTAAKHSFRPVKQTGIYYCNVCDKLIGGLFSLNAQDCIKCGIIVHNLCRYKRKQQCKSVTTKVSNKSPHEWVDGNIPINTICSVCELICVSYFNNSGCRCLWCQRYVHDECKGKLDENCDYGNLKNALIQPNEIQYILPLSQGDKLKQLIQNGKKKLQKQIQQRMESDDNETDTEYLKKQPDSWILNIDKKKCLIIVVINIKSGGQFGIDYLKEFYKFLNPIQVINLLEDGLERLKIFKNVQNLKIIVGGGDGTVASVVNYIKSGDIQEWRIKNPPVAVLALGTGNDLSRSLGWGAHACKLGQIQSFLQKINSQGQPILFDRWKIQFDKKCLEQKNEFIMYNYFSIGLDAKTCYNFHKLREKHPNLFKSRVGNKFIYSQIGAADMIIGKNFNLGEICVLKVDDKIIQIPSNVQNLVFVNVLSWAGGASRLWNIKNDEDFTKQSMSDNKLEVLGVTSILHLGQVQINIDEPIRIAQGYKICLNLLGEDEHALQIDGEPFLQKAPLNIKIGIIDQVFMMTHKEQLNLQYESQILNVLEWAEKQNHIDENQKQILLNKFLRIN